MEFKNINRKRVVIYDNTLSMFFRGFEESGEHSVASNYPYYFEQFQKHLTYFETTAGLLRTWDHYCFKVNRQKYYFKITDPQKFILAKIKYGI